jgi:hypothetical protein
MLLRVKQTVENVGGKVVGVVLNNVDLSSDVEYQYYTSYYTYYSPTNSPSDGPEGKKSRRRRIKTETTAPVFAEARPASSGGAGDLF